MSRLIRLIQSGDCPSSILVDGFPALYTCIVLGSLFIELLSTREQSLSRYFVPFLELCELLCPSFLRSERLTGRLFPSSILFVAWTYRSESLMVAGIEWNIGTGIECGLNRRMKKRCLQRSIAWENRIIKRNYQIIDITASNWVFNDNYYILHCILMIMQDCFYFTLSFFALFFYRFRYFIFINSISYFC